MRKFCLNCYRKHLGMAQVFWDLAYIESITKVDEESPLPEISIIEQLAQAQILYAEWKTGMYDEHFWLAMGHVAIVEQILMLQRETLSEQLAARIRIERLDVLADEKRDFEWGYIRNMIHNDEIVENAIFKYDDFDVYCQANIKEAISESHSNPPTELTTLALALLNSDSPNFVEAIKAATEIALQTQEDEVPKKKKKKKKKKSSRKGSKPSKGRDSDLP